MNLYLVLGTVEAGFLNLWIIGYAVMLLLSGQRGEAVVAHAARRSTSRRYVSTAASSPARPQCARRSSSNSSIGAVLDIGPRSRTVRVD